MQNGLSSHEINTNTIVVEEEYISKDFLHDYISYYALCFEKYQKFCKRIHFLKAVIDEEELKKLILDKECNKKFFEENYLGFIVVKPIPYTIFGFTILKTYQDIDVDTHRNFWGVRKYKIHFFGHEIKLNSLAFQEQDTVLAACATTSIWSMLNKASSDYNTILKSPSQITKDADIISPDGSRLFPNKGLNLLQICKAILNSGLVSEVKQADFELIDKDNNLIGNVVSNNYLKKILRAYSTIGIPIILVINVPINNGYGHHAITISGFSENNPIKIPLDNSKISWLSENIQKIYAHDDQWGPFVSIGFNNYSELITPWSEIDKYKRPTYVTNVIVPIYPKIRISYEDIEAIVLGIDTIFSLFFDNLIKSDLVWEIKIHFSENIKNQIRHSNLEDSEKLNKLTMCLPKYLWIANCYIENIKIFEFTFDATDVNNGMLGEDFICYLTSDFKPIFLEFISSNRILLEPLLGQRNNQLYYDFLISKLS